MESQRPTKTQNICMESLSQYTPYQSQSLSPWVIEDAMCEACCLGEETSGHMFWECIKACDTWTATGLTLDTRGVRFREYVDLLWHLIFIPHAGKDMLELIITISWCMWYNRNKTRLGFPRQSSHDIIMKARSMLHDFHLAHFQYCNPSSAEEVRWTPPVFPCYKVNMNAAVFKNTKSVGIGVIVWDHVGDVLATLSTQLPLPLGPLEAEAQAMDVAISFAKEIGLQEVTFESDSSVLIGALLDKSKAPISIENIITVHDLLGRPSGGPTDIYISLSTLISLQKPHNLKRLWRVFVFDCLCCSADQIRRRMAGHQCCSNPPTLDPSAGAGHVEQLCGLSTYVTGSPNAKHAIILISDVFGYEAPKLRKLADKVSAAGYYVVVPDFIREPFVLEDIANNPLEVWLKDHGTDKGFEEAKPIIETLKSKGASSVGAAGFCWGGKVVVELSKVDLIQAAVILHPTWVTVDDIKGVKVPIAVLGAEIDIMAPPELLKQYDEALTSQSKVDFYVKIFPKVIHGWTTRYEDEDEVAVKSAEEAHQNLLDWFAKYIK